MKRIAALLLAAVCALSTLGCKKTADAIDYAKVENWAYLEEGTDDQQVDLFFLCPTVDLGKDGHINMNLGDEETKTSFLGATNMELGIYENCTVYAPYYRQMTLSAYRDANSEAYLQTAYADVKAAFLYYYENYNNGRPFVLAGFSQGAEMGMRLMQDVFSDAKYVDNLVAAYLIGWRVTEKDIAGKPWMRMAEGERDTGCIVSFEAEAPAVTDSFVVPAGTRALSINPLNWKTDGTPAPATLNLGACFTDYAGEITREIPRLTGAYLDATRGTLKAPDVSPADYPPVLDLFAEGEYHLYDYQFFYRNLQENVAVRTDAFLGADALEQAA